MSSLEDKLQFNFIQARGFFISSLNLSYEQTQRLRKTKLEFIFVELIGLEEYFGRQGLRDAIYNNDASILKANSRKEMPKIVPIPLAA